MLRVLVAGLVGAVLLQLWSAVSAALLPWPDTRTRPLPAPTGVLEMTFPPPPGTAGPQSAPPPEHSPRPVVRAAVQGQPALPLAFSRMEPIAFDNTRVLTVIAIDLAVGLLAALFVLAIPQPTPWTRQLALLLVAAVGAVLLGDLNPAVIMQWPTSYVAALCTDHFAAIGLAAGGACLVLRSRWPVQGARLFEKTSLPGG